jgi:IS605 OrfB family transposase
VTPYDLPYQAKDALKSYVPKLRKIYDADEIHDEHPLRLVNRAAKFDHDAGRSAEFVWNVPQPGRGTNFWIPLRINPEQRELWFDLLGDDAKAGEVRVQQNRTSLIVHVTIEHDVKDPEPSDDPTHVGFDIGESALITGCALQADAPTDPFLIDGGRARHLCKEMFTTLRRMQERGVAESRRDDRYDHYGNALTDIVEKASHDAVEYAESFADPVIVMEDLTFIRERLDYGKYMNRRLHAWAFAQLQSRIEDKATEAGIPVRFVNPAYTSKTCHDRKRIGRRSNQAEFRCPNPECHVSTFQADINAAANIARRANPWGESVRWKPGRDDTPENGSTRDSAMIQREQSAPTQMTLASYQGPKPTAQ